MDNYHQPILATTLEDPYFADFAEINNSSVSQLEKNDIMEVP